MSNSLEIDPTPLLRAAPRLSATVNAFEAGRAAAGRAAAANAFSTIPAPPEPHRPTPPQMAAAPALDPAGRAELLGAVANGLAQTPYGERRAMLAHLAPALARHGLPPAATLGFDPTDANLAAVRAQIRVLTDDPAAADAAA